MSEELRECNAAFIEEYKITKRTDIDGNLYTYSPYLNTEFRLQISWQAFRTAWMLAKKHGASQTQESSQ